MIRRAAQKVWAGFDGLAYDTIWAISHDGAALAVVLFSFLSLQQVLSPGVYGNYVALYALIAPVGALCYSGPSLAALKAILRDKKDVDLAFAQFVPLVVLLGLAGSISVIVLSSFIIDELPLVEVAMLVAAELLGTGVIFVFATLMQATRGYPALVRIRLGMLGLKFSLLIVLVMFDSRLSDTPFLGSLLPSQSKFESLTIGHLGIGYLVMYGGYGLWLLAYQMPRAGYSPSFRRVRKQSLVGSLVFAVPMAAGQIQTEADKAVLKLFQTSVETGLYGAAYRVVLLGLAPLRALDSAGFQRFLSDSEVRGQHLRRSVQFAALMFGVGCVISAVMYLSLPLLKVLFADGYEEAAQMVPWLLLLIPLISLSGTPLNGLVGLNRSVERSYIYLGCSGFSLLMYFVLISAWGWRGAVAATMLGEVLLVVCSWVAVVHYQRVADSELEIDLTVRQAELRELN